MRLSFTPLDGDVFALDVPDDTVVSGLKLLVSVECGTPENMFILMKDGQPLPTTDKQLKDVGLKEDDLIILFPAAQQSIPPASNSRPGTAPSGPRLDFSSVRLPGTGPPVPNNEAETIRQTILNGPPHLRSLLGERNPELASVLNDQASFARVYEAQRTQETRRREELNLVMNADPLDPTTQARIAELIRQKNIDQHMETALEHYPETFAQVSMLFVQCKVGNHPIKAFVDSGAQSTIMSERCAQRCNLEPWIDKRWAGMAYGVGTQTIIGRVHNGQIEIGGAFLPTSFIVLKDQQLDLMIGLDMLKRHQCCIDLNRNVLTLDAGRLQTPFLPESEIPLHMRHAELMSNDQASLPTQQMLDFEATDIRYKWSAEEVPFLFVFDDPHQITRFIKDLRIKDVFRIVLDAIAIPLTNVLRSPETYPFMELTFHDVKYVHKFRDYVFQLPDLATKNKGTLVAGTKSLRIYSGERLPNYIVATQWTHKEYFAQYLQDVEDLLNGEQYACTVRVLFTVTPHYAPPDI
ncbi:aspartyl protease, partial [Opisthorchis viverrini]